MESHNMATNEVTPESTTESLAAYDEVPYSSHPYSQTTPNRLAVMGTLFGMTPAPVDRCRVLELGSASGGNLIPVAAILPNSRFVGLDLSSVQIADGQRTIEALGLENIELRHLSIMDIDASLGKFDYIICHGVYSWVPAEVRQKILDVCAEHLEPQGVAYISYNTYPGWHMRGTIRDMMLYHSRKWTKPQEKIGHSRALLDFLVKSVTEDSGPYANLLRREMELMRNQADNYVLHDHLETVNHPVYFHEFAEQAAASGLQFFAEADLAAMSLQGLAPDIRNIVRQLSQNLVECEQYVDFIRNRTFRRSLLCRQDVALDWKSMPARVRSLYVASTAAPEGTIDIQAKAEAKFKLPGGTLSTQAPLIKASLLVLGERWPESMPFEQLLDETLRRLGLDPSNPTTQRERYAQLLADNMVQCYSQRAIHFYAFPPPIKSRPGERPKAFRMARHQAQTQARVTSLLHELVALSEFDRQLVRLADGQRTREDILAELSGDVRSGKLIPSAGIAADPSQIQAALSKTLNDTLERLGRLALLEA